MSDTVNWDSHIWNDRYREINDQPSGEWQSAPNSNIIRLLGGLTPSTALDVACGTGRHTVWLAEQGWQAHGLDFSSVGLDLARRRAAASGVAVRLHQGDVLGGWTPEKSFDLVMLSYLHYRHHGVVQVIDRMAQWVAPGGHLLVVGFDESSHPLEEGGPNLIHQFYSVDLLSTAMRNKGLEISHTSVEQHRPEADNESGALVFDTVVMARNP